MDRIIKLQSRQGGPFTAQQNLIDFEIPNDGVYNLADSYININVQPDVTPTSTAGGADQAVYPVSFKWASAPQDAKFQNVASVKNCSMRCANKGQIESIRRVDVLKNTLAGFDKSQREVAAGEAYLAASQLKDPIQEQQGTILCDLNKSGTTKSRYLDTAPIQIALSDLMDFCKTEEFDTEKAGTTQIHLECNLDKLQLKAINQSATWDPSWLLFTDITAVGTAQDANTITWNQEAETEKDHPFHVGQALLIDASGTGGAVNVVAAPAVVSNIDWDKTSGDVNLTFEQKWGDLAIGHGYVDISCTTAAVTSATPLFNSAELVVKKVAQPEGFDQIEYSTFSTEQDNGNSLKSFTKQYQVEPEATSVVIAFPDGAAGDLFSTDCSFTEYRLRINQEETTDRNIAFRRPIYYDQLNMTMTNMGKSLKNLTANAGATAANITWPNVYKQGDLATLVIASPMPQTINEKLLQVNIEAIPAGPGVNKLNLYKELPRVFQY